MAATELAGLDVIKAAAAQQGIDISDALAISAQIMAIDSAAIKAGSTQLRTMASGLDTTAQGVQRTGSNLLAGWTGSAADAFAPQHADLVSRIGSQRDTAGLLADGSDAVAAVFADHQQVIRVATGVAATAIGVAG